MNLARRQFILACWLLLLCGTTAFALDPTKAITQYVHDVWTSKEGLPRNTVLAIAQTRDGYLWFGTWDGLVRFDGLRFTVFDDINTPVIKNKFITTLFVDREGNLWAGTFDNEIIRYTDGQFTSYPLPPKSGTTPVNKIYQGRDGTLWIGTYDGLYQFKDGRFTAYNTKDGLSHKEVSAIIQDSAGSLWIGTRAGLDQFKNGQFIHYTSQQGLSPGVVSTLYEDRSGVLWIGTQVFGENKGGLTRFKDGRFNVYTVKDGLVFNMVNTILEDRDGNLWIGTSGGGLSRFRDGKFTAFTTKDALTDDGIDALYEDREGSLWVGTENGLNRLRDGKFSTFTKAHGLPHNSVTSVYEDQAGSLWLGTYGGGLAQFKDGRFIRHSIQEELSGLSVFTVRGDAKGNLWSGTSSRLNLFQQGKLRSYLPPNGLQLGHVGAIIEDQTGTLWIGTDNGVCRIKDGTFTRYTTADGMAGNYVMVLHADRAGSLWVGTENGLSQFRDGKFTTFTSEAAPKAQIKTFYEDQEGYLWIGAEGKSVGLFRYKDGQFTRYTARNGLLDDAVYSILDDGQGNFWMSCGRGIFRTSRQGLQDFAAGKSQTIICTAYDTADGLQSRECNAGPEAGWKTRDGRLWFGTYKGLAVIDPANIHYNKLPPSVVIEQAIADGSNFSLTQPQQLAAGTQNLEFQYAGLSLVAAGKNQYKYQLVGYDKTWIDAGNRRAAYYTNLRPGNYTFRVIASNNDGVWNETGAAYSFYLKPYFWQTWWFYGLCVGGLVLAGFGLNNLRTKRVMAREREKTQLKIAELRLEKTQVQAQALEAEHNRKTQELEEARRLQLSMLPKGNVRLERLEITGAMRTATEVGGDYYDFLPLPDGRYCVVIGDATGHGMSAGLIVGMVKMGLTGRLQAQPDLKPMMEDLNAALRQSLTHRGVGMCLGAMMIDPVTLQVELCSNGMPFPYHFTQGELRAIELKAQPLGFLKRVNVPTTTLQLQPGEALIWLSDGFEERMNARNEEWGTEQVAAALREICPREESGEAIAHALMAACDRASDGRSNDDDMTIVVMKAVA